MAKFEEEGLMDENDCFPVSALYVDWILTGGNTGTRFGGGEELHVSTTR